MKTITLISILIAMIFLTSCDKVKKPICNTAIPAVATMISTRWSCDYAKFEEFIVKPAADKICPVEDTTKALPICGTIVGLISKMGAEAVSEKMGCDPEKVKKDFDTLTGLCSL